MAEKTEGVFSAYETILANEKDHFLEGNETFFSAFRRKEVEIVLETLHQGTQHETQWYIDSGTAGFYLKPIFIRHDLDIAQEQWEKALSTIQKSAALQSILNAFNVVMSFLFQEKVIDQSVSSFELRKILIDRLKNTTDLKEKSILAQLMRHLNIFQKAVVSEKIQKRIQSLHAEMKATDLLEKTNAQVETGLTIQIFLELTPILEDIKLSIEKDVDDALKGLQKSLSEVKDIDAILGEVKSLVARLKTSSEFTSSADQLENALKNLDPKSIHQNLSELIDSILQWKSMGALPQEEPLLKEQAEVIQQQVRMFNELMKQFHEIKTQLRENQKEELQHISEQELLLDKIQADGVIFENDEPWENIN